MTAEIVYKGELRCELKHLFSGTTILTDAPVDNHGKAQAFSPTDLLAASAASCMLTIMGIAAPTHGYNIDETKITVNKIMASNPRRVAALEFDLYFPPNDYTDKQKQVIEHIAHTCPVMLSLHPDIEKKIVLHF